MVTAIRESQVECVRCVKKCMKLFTYEAVEKCMTWWFSRVGGKENDKTCMKNERKKKDQSKDHGKEDCGGGKDGAERKRMEEKRKEGLKE